MRDDLWGLVGGGGKWCDSFAESEKAARFVGERRNMGCVDNKGGCSNFFRLELG